MLNRQAKPLDLYRQEEEESQGSLIEVVDDRAAQGGDDEEDEEAAGQGYHFDVDGMDDDEDRDEMERPIDPEEQQRRQNDILFAIQGVGEIKQVNGFDVFVKKSDCEASLKDIHKYIKYESNVHPIVKLTLGEWKFL